MFVHICWLSAHMSVHVCVHVHTCLQDTSDWWLLLCSVQGAGKKGRDYRTLDVSRFCRQSERAQQTP